MSRSPGQRSREGLGCLGVRDTRSAFAFHLCYEWLVSCPLSPSRGWGGCFTALRLPLGGPAGLCRGRWLARPRVLLCGEASRAHTRFSPTQRHRLSGLWKMGAPSAAAVGAGPAETQRGRARLHQGPRQGDGKCGFWAPAPGPCRGSARPQAACVPQGQLMWTVVSGCVFEGFPACSVNALVFFLWLGVQAENV